LRYDSAITSHSSSLESPNQHNYARAEEHEP
jgi:hypothetical protein